MRNLVAIIFLLVGVNTAFAKSDYFFSVIDGNKGLSQNHVKSIIHDSYGFMWFGTRNKLNRFDGVTIKTFNCYDHELKKGNNNISALFESPDNKLWIGTDKGVYIFDPGTEKFSSFDMPSTDGHRMNDWVSEIQMDNDSNIWVVIPNQGVFKFNFLNHDLIKYTVVDKILPSVSNPQCIAIENNGSVWIGTNGSGLYLFNKNTNSFNQYLGDSDLKNTLVGKDIFVIKSFNDEILIGLHEGKLMGLNKRKNTLTDFAFSDANYKIIRDINVLDSKVWVGTENGLFIFDKQKKSVEHYENDPVNIYSLSDNVIEKVYADREGNIWIGTAFGGVNCIPYQNNSIEKYVPLSTKNSISSKRIREMHEDKDGNIWISSEDAGVDIFDPVTGTFSSLKNLQGNKVMSLLIQESNVWVGYFKKGLDIVNMRTLSVKHFTDKDLGLNESSVYALCEDKDGRIWLGNAWGVYIAEKGQMKFKHLEEFGLVFTYDIYEDTEGYIWIATMGRGVFQYNPRNKIFNHYLNDNSPNSLSSNSVSSITEDHLGHIWFSTDRGGICCFDKSKSTFKSFSIADGLPDDVAYKIIEDKQKNLWFGTNNGLVCFNPQSKDIKVYTQNNGLTSNQFNYKAGFISSSGKLCFGNLHGLISFNPEEFKSNLYEPPVFITSLSIHNKEIKPSDDSGILKKSILFTDKIVLTHKEANIGFDFVALSYTAPMANKYKYKMENIDKDWVITSNTHSASYAMLPAGSYTFSVIGSNNDGLWNEQGDLIEIEILPPWWTSTLAIILYYFVLSLLIYLFVKRYLKLSKKRNREKQTLYEIEKEKELYESKVEFFTNIAHEIRTPVTLIKGPLESILEKPIKDEALKHDLKIIEQNTNRLLELINQLLDFRKVESNKVYLFFRRTNINILLMEVIERFEQSFHLQDKNLKVNMSEFEVFAWIDKEGLTKIISNLLSNAIKYSSKNITVELKSDGISFFITLYNDGEIIPDEMCKEIFEPFFQIKSTKIGSGLGLPLALSIAKLHNGELVYDSISGENCFTLKIPILQENGNTETIDELDSKDDFIYDQSEASLTLMTHQQILVVEDNLDMLNFISDRLKPNFIVEKATNGIEAIEILKSKHIDIIVSDIMMPEMDGLELCKKVKSDIEYCHIIFIVLSAKNDLTSKIKGLELGADAYVEKPFSFQYFNTLLSSLLNKKLREKELYLQKPFIPIQQISMNKSDEQFMNNTIAIINENITDSDFNVEKLAELAYISRSSLHRKFKNLLDLSPVDFIRIVRLKKAAQLIKEDGCRVNEVCYLVGINSPSYFIKLFQKQFGMTPKEFEKQSTR
jgi:signal transduction histidine kinase/ligand-binding sensor domain-containing protein/DNA-binding response OmpR family regulator